MTHAARTQEVTPIMRMALRSFGQARAAIAAGNVDEMIGQLTRGVDLLDVIEHSEAPVARRRPRRKSAS